MPSDVRPDTSPSVRHLDAFLLSREWRDQDDGVEIVLWARAEACPIRVRVRRQEAVMFVPRDVITQNGRRVPRPLTTLYGDPIDAVYFRSQRALTRERDRLREAMDVSLESDVKPADRFLMERFVTGAMQIEGPAYERDGVLHFDNPRITASSARPRLSILSLDIETEGLGGALLSAAVAAPEGQDVVFMRGVGVDRDDLSFVRDERALLIRLFDEIARRDPDVLCGWNITEFDLTYLESRARDLDVPFAIGRAGERARVLPGASGRVSIAKVPGRVVLDGIATLKSATYSFDRFTLDHVAQELLGRGKKIEATGDPVQEILRMYAEDQDKLAAYNLEDCRLVLDIFHKADLLGFAMERAHLTGLPMDRQGGSVAAFDHLYLPRLHRKGVVAPDVAVDVGEITPSPGGHVLESTPGLYRDVLSFDFRSLYPSIIRTFRIDPLGLSQPGEDPIPGEDGAVFARDPDRSILPDLIRSLFEARVKALAEDNAPLSRAIKILMNSFYGVLGTPGCRFFDSRLPTSITRRGHAIIERARSWFEHDHGLHVIYGDTDSLFVHLKDSTGASQESIRARGQEMASSFTKLLADEIAREHRIESYLELRFESHYLRFLMPTTRGADRGSKKRYAGTVQKGASGETQLVMRGLEAVRRDWTALARRVQVELFRRVFAGEPYEEWLREIVTDLQDGKLDTELTYRKRLRRDLEAYSGGVPGGPRAPPHVAAARILSAIHDSSRAHGPDSSDGVFDRDHHLGEIEYVVTRGGPEPLEQRTHPIDYDHYVDRQLGPVCDVILPFVGSSFERVAGAQTSLF